MRIYPRSTLKRLIRANLSEDQASRLSKDVDVYVYLAFLMYLKRLSNESRLRMQADVVAGITSSRKRMQKRHVVGARRRIRM